MSVLVRNLQQSMKVNVARVEADAGLLKGFLGLQAFDLGILCVDRDNIRNLNKTYRDQDTSTDILAFPSLQVIEPGVIEEPGFTDDYNLGDIYLGMTCVEACSNEEGYNLHHMIVILLAHGLCHLIGYDHDSPQRWKMMYGKELDILDKYNALAGTQLKSITAVGH